MELPEEEKSAIDSIEHELYNPNNKMDDVSLHHVRDSKMRDLPSAWGENTPLIKEVAEKGISFGAKLLIISGIILLVALAFSAWRILSSRNVVSSANIEMTAEIAPYIEGGESAPLIFTLQNKNVSSLENANITLLYKQGTGSQDEQEKVHEKRDLGTINSGEYKRQDFQVVLYGSEAEARDINIKLEYKVPGSNAIFSKTLTTSVVLKTPPISVNIDGPSVLSIGQDGDFTISVKNNSATTSIMSVLQLTLPNTFTINSTTPNPGGRSTSWTIPTLKSGETTVININGSLSGTSGETATIRAIIGSQGETVGSVGIVYASQIFDIGLREPPLVFKFALDTDRGNSDTLRYGDNTTLSITYINNSEKPLQNVSLKLEIKGDAPILKQIDPGTGYYDSIKQTISWDKVSVADLATLLPHKEGVLRVVIPIVLKGINSPGLKLTLTGNGTAQETDDVTAVLSKSWVVQGSANINVETRYKNSPFQNTGPVPPVVNTATTYTAHIAVSAQNSLLNTKVSFLLPAYVTWRGVTTDGTNISYDNKTRTVVWAVGSIPAGKTVFADIGLSVFPSQSHLGKSPSITSGVVLDTDEEESKAHIHTTVSALTTNLASENWSGDPSFVVDK